MARLRERKEVVRPARTLPDRVQLHEAVTLQHIQVSAHRRVRQAQLGRQLLDGRIASPS